MNQHNVLHADSIQFTYPNRPPLLTGAHLCCTIGQIIGLLGRNGSGKSTLLKIVYGEIKAHHSHIKINGRLVNKAYLTNQVRYLPQHAFLPSHERVNRMIKLLTPSTDFREAILTDIRIQSFQNERIFQLSGGELRYLELCLLLYQPGDFVLLDEPFTGLEPLYIQHISELISSFQDRKGFVITDHNYRQVLDLCTDILLLQHGTCKTILDKRSLEFHYLPEGTFD